MQGLLHTPEVWLAIAVAIAIIALILWHKPKAVLEDEAAPLSPNATPDNPRECPPYRQREMQPARDRDAPPVEPSDERKRRADDDGPHAVGTFDDASYDSLPTADYAHDEVADPTVNSQQADNTKMSDLLKDPVADRREVDLPVPLPITGDNLGPAVLDSGVFTCHHAPGAVDSGWAGRASE